MLILGIHSGHHDACAALYDEYRLVAAVALERLTRRKIDGGRVPDECVEEVLAVAGASRREVGAVVLGRAAFPSRYYSHLPAPRLVEARVRQLIGREKHKTMEREMVRYRRTDSEAMFNAPRFLRDHDLPPGAKVSFFNHHMAHALPTLFHTDWNDALLYTADGGGDNVQYSHRVFSDGQIATLDGGDEAFLSPMAIDSLGLAYGYATQALGFRINKHEGKLTGLAALGQPTLAPALAKHFRVDEKGRVLSDFESYPAMRRFVFEWAEGQKREDVAASVQRVLEDFILESVRRLLARTGVRHLGLSGGVFANVRLNQRLAEELPVDEIFVYPAMSDQGLAAGGVLQFLLERDGPKTWLANRYRLDNLYLGRDFGGGIDATFAADPRFTKVSDTPVDGAADLIHAGRIVAIYTRGMEYGPRALGARTIMAAPTDAVINQTLNDRLDRSEFMPFAPVVLAERAEEVFDLGPAKTYAARFMTVTCGVRDGWRERIPATVHVDGTARPQVIERRQNPLYYDIVKAYADRSGIPVLINTSFNVHEEPIINTPAECARALADRRIDFVVTEQAVWGLTPAP
jgi:carbamoyltransferase